MIDCVIKPNGGTGRLNTCGVSDTTGDGGTIQADACDDAIGDG